MLTSVQMCNNDTGEAVKMIKSVQLELGFEIDTRGEIGVVSGTLLEGGFESETRRDMTSNKGAGGHGWLGPCLSVGQGRHLKDYQWRER